VDGLLNDFPEFGVIKSIEEPHNTLPPTKGAPTLGEVGEEGGFVFEDFVVALVEAVDFGEGKIAAEQIGQRAAIKPMPVESPFAAGINQAVEDEGLEDLIPTCALPSLRRFLQRKNMKALHHC